MYNRAFLIGNLTRDAELRYTSAGIPVARFTLAINRPVKSGSDKTGEADFINIVAWRKLAEICGEYLKKGMSVAIEGRLQIRSYEKNGEKIFMTEVVADNMQMLSRKKVEAGSALPESAAAEEPRDSANEEEIPF